MLLAVTNFGALVFFRRVRGIKPNPPPDHTRDPPEEGYEVWPVTPYKRLLASQEASKFLHQECVVLCAYLLDFQPLHVALKPGVVTLLGTLPRKTSLPLSRPLFTVCAGGQLPELPPSFGIGDVLQRGLEELLRPGDYGLSLVVKDLCLSSLRGVCSGRMVSSSEGASWSRHMMPALVRAHTSE
jgi:hypothetical protein